MSDRRINSAESPAVSAATVFAWTGLLLGVAIIGILDMPAMIWAGDPVIWRYEARQILQGQLSVDPQQLPANAEPGQLAVQNPRNGLWYSKYGVMNTLMVLPPTAADWLTGGKAEPITHSRLLIYNLWNVLLTVALAASLMKLSGRYTDRIPTRIAFVAIILYTTFLWYYLRAQGSEICQTLFFTLAFLFLVRFLDSLRDVPNPRLVYLAWLFIAALVFTRVLYGLLVPLALLLIAFAAYRLPAEQRPRARTFLSCVLVPPLLIALLLGAINFYKFGSPFLSGYHQWKPEDHLPTGRWSEGLWGFFVQPRFSIFLYFPPLVFALFGLRAFVRKFPLDAVAAFACGLGFILLIAKIPTWSGEWTYGPRYVLFALPVMSLPLILLIDRLIDSPRILATWLLAGPMALVLLYSAYLQIRVNQIDFQVYYYIREPIRPHWSPPIEARFMNWPVGMVVDDIIRHRDNPQDMPWMVELSKILSTASMDGYVAHLRFFIDKGNHYWWWEGR